MRITAENPKKAKPRISIGIAFHSPKQPLRRAVLSALAQSVPGHEVCVIILDSSQGFKAHGIMGSLATRPNVHLLRGRARCAYAARNLLIAYAESRIVRLAWHVRLDADDVFSGRNSLEDVFAGVSPRHRIILAGNRQLSEKGEWIGKNLPSIALKRRPCLLKRISLMAAGKFESELPSCNLIMRAGFGWRYPARKSAEDHWLVARLLLQLPSASLLIRQVELVDYHVGGQATAKNQKSGTYCSERRRLLEAAKGWRRND